MNEVEQKNITNNQSQADYTQSNVFIFDNRYDGITFTNATASAEVILKSGHILFKTAAGVVDILAAATGIADVVGIARMENDTTLADAASIDINMGVSGTISEENLELNGLTLDTLIPTTTRTLRDQLNSLGFHLSSGVENTKHDNS